MLSIRFVKKVFQDNMLYWCKVKISLDVFFFLTFVSSSLKTPKLNLRLFFFFYLSHNVNTPVSNSKKVKDRLQFFTYRQSIFFKKFFTHTDTITPKPTHTHTNTRSLQTEAKVKHVWHKFFLWNWTYRSIRQCTWLNVLRKKSLDSSLPTGGIKVYLYQKQYGSLLQHTLTVLHQSQAAHCGGRFNENLKR